jgi:hypothetical protein
VLEPEINLSGFENAPYNAAVERLRTMLSDFATKESKRAQLAQLHVDMC